MLQASGRGERVGSRAFREEQREWRRADLDWRTHTVQQASTKLAQRELFRQWRAYSEEQRLLGNCQALWSRHVVRNQRDVEEAVEKLKVLAQLGALTAGFAVSAFYDFQWDPPPVDLVLPFFGLATALTVGFELNCCVLCTLMLSSAVKVGKSYISEEEEAEYLWRVRHWAVTCGRGALPPAPRRDFRRHWDARCEGRWRTALTLFLAGIPTFFAVMGLAGYLKFWASPATVVVTAVIMAAAFVYTLGLSSDWAKALLGRRRDDPALEAQWQGGGWWQAADQSRALPFGFHQVPDKDSVWPPPYDAVRQQPPGAADDLPYPAILGLAPWPTAVSLSGAPGAAAAAMADVAGPGAVRCGGMPVGSGGAAGPRRAGTNSAEAESLAGSLFEGSDAVSLSYTDHGVRHSSSAAGSLPAGALLAPSAGWGPSGADRPSAPDRLPTAGPGGGLDGSQATPATVPASAELPLALPLAPDGTGEGSSGGVASWASGGGGGSGSGSGSGGAGAGAGLLTLSLSLAGRARSGRLAPVLASVSEEGGGEDRLGASQSSLGSGPEAQAGFTEAPTGPAEALTGPRVPLVGPPGGSQVRRRPGRGQLQEEGERPPVAVAGAGQGGGLGSVRGEAGSGGAVRQAGAGGGSGWEQSGLGAGGRPQAGPGPPAP
ncbi:hypothetical protein HYH03_008832 [Edaphochlamys debaryana]|uniref:Uncharacterized protein n=1 Tax=Edaphochlamys debaryana TaxID=47281 RepID=A0A835Y8F2_9CHLO|nr:hypothetical protein HYH03_008832 [Edaphochlamys debaryana]|eukprot:KAG2492919.1 hypothetical protein HYH03_008832 [Edaphochlamys debaryana]